MTRVRQHTYTVDPADFNEFVSRRGTLIAAIRAAHPGLADARLTRFDDGTFYDVWSWDSAEQMDAALAALADFPEVQATMSITRDHTAIDGTVIDAR